MREIEEHLFGRLDKHKMLDSDSQWVPGTEETGPEEMGDCVEAIPMEAFVTNILDIRPDHDASFLDLYILQTRAERDEVVFNQKLDNIEAMLGIGRTASSGAPLAVPGLPPAESKSENIQPEEPNTGTSVAADPWLQGLPTEVLFAELKHRASLQPNSSLPAIDVD